MAHLPWTPGAVQHAAAAEASVWPNHLFKTLDNDRDDLRTMSIGQADTASSPITDYRLRARRDLQQAIPYLSMRAQLIKHCSHWLEPALVLNLLDDDLRSFHCMLSWETSRPNLSNPPAEGIQRFTMKPYRSRTSCAT